MPRVARQAVVESLFRGSLLHVGLFRCPPDDDRWFRENWIGDRAHIVFPHLPVAIRQRGGGSLIADPTQVVLYRAGEHYQRRRLSPDGDRSTFLTVEPDAQGDLAAAIASTHVTVEASDVLRMRMLAELCRRPDADPLEVEEESLRLVDRILRRCKDAGRVGETFSSTVGSRRIRATTIRAHEHAVLEAQRFLAANASVPRSLAEIGSAVGTSPFHLARLFRARTGLSLHRYRDQLRLRMALDRLADDDPDLATIALDLGFSSHSHFDDRFRRAFNRSPSTIRTLLRRDRTQTSTIMEALRATPA